MGTWAGAAEFVCVEERCHAGEAWSPEPQPLVPPALAAPGENHVTTLGYLGPHHSGWKSMFASCTFVWALGRWRPGPKPSELGLRRQSKAFTLVSLAQAATCRLIDAQGL